MVKAGALGGTHDYVAWDRTWSNHDHKNVHRGGMVLKLRPLATVAGIDQIFTGHGSPYVRYVPI